MVGKLRFLSKSDLLSYTRKFTRSVWLWPAVAAIPVVVFTCLQISGSSIGTFHQLLYGSGSDPSLVLNQPEPIRSDEWLVGTQMTIAQQKTGYHRVNPNLGNGEDVSLMADVPYKEWSELFRPQNLAFFILPFATAFAFHWWIMGYLLIVSCYFFVLTLLPKKRLLAASLSAALFFAAFIQWWYLYGTLSPIYYSLFIATACIYLGKQSKLWKKLALGALIAYLLACFALVLYPPFQIACGLVLAAFLVGYLLENYKAWGRRKTLQTVGIVAASGALALLFVGAFALTRPDTIKSMTQTAYPGKRVIQSGGVKADHFLSSQLGHQFVSLQTAGQYKIDDTNPTNQSEGSNFLLLAPFLAIPCLSLLSYDYLRRREVDWPLLLQCVLFVVFLLELFVPAFTPLSKLLLLHEVGGYRALIGVGLLNLIMLVLFVRNLERKKFAFPARLVLPYVLLILAVELVINLHAHYSFGLFVGLKRAILYALPLPLIIYLLLRKRFIASVAIYLLFSVFISWRVNPLYRGLTTLTNDPLSIAVRTIGHGSNKRWTSDGGYLENIALINGERSLSGVYSYPQFDLWSKIPNTQSATYNRYAHVGTQISDDPALSTKLKLIGGDSFVVQTFACSDYLKQQNVGFIVTSAVLQNECITLQKTLHYPSATLYIYSIN